MINVLVQFVVLVEFVAFIIAEAVYLFIKTTRKSFAVCYALNTIGIVVLFIFEHCQITSPLVLYVLVCTALLLFSHRMKNVFGIICMLFLCTVLIVVGMLFKVMALILCVVVSEIIIHRLFVIIRENDAKILIEFPNELSNHYDDIYRAFIDYIEQKKAYLDPNICLESVAIELGKNRCYLSRAINKYSDLSFSLLINKYRIEYAKEYMKRHPRASLEEIAVQCGFNTISNFFYSFRREEKMSPKDWCKNNRR